MSNRSIRSPGTSHERDNLPPRFRREVNYYLLNDGSDEEAEPEDRLPNQRLMDLSIMSQAQTSFLKNLLLRY
ncbi:hypothetical protein V1527DRAFT_69923 [Lipomyces starkeyi]